MTPKVLYYVLFLITLPDIESEEHLVHRIVFEKEVNCLYHAKILNQHKDPWVQKPNCVAVESHYKNPEVPIPLRKPEFMR